MSENPTPEPEHILLHADWSTARHEQPESCEVVEHERKRRERAPFVPPASPKAAERLMDAEIAEHADRTVEFLPRYEAGLAPTDGAGPVGSEEATA